MPVLSLARISLSSLLFISITWSACAALELIRDEIDVGYYVDSTGYEINDTLNNLGNRAGLYPSWTSIPNGLISNVKYDIAEFKPNELSKPGEEYEYFSKSDNITTYLEFKEFNYMLNSTIYVTDKFDCLTLFCEFKISFPIKTFESEVFKSDEMLYQLTGLKTIFQPRNIQFEHSTDPNDIVFFWYQPLFVNIVGIAKVYNHTNKEYLYQGKSFNTSMPLVFQNKVVGFISFKGKKYVKVKARLWDKVKSFFTKPQQF